MIRRPASKQNQALPVMLPSRSILRPASARQLGTVRKSIYKTKWSAQFRFQCDGERSSLDGPARASQAAAEKDRKFIAAAASIHSRSSRMEAASAAIRRLCSGEAPTLPDGPGSASTICNIGADELAKMSKLQIRSLVAETPGITMDKKNKKGTWDSKTCKELKEELLAMTAGTATQTLSGRQTAKKRPASSLARCRA